MATVAASGAPGAVRAWGLALRPRTLPAALAPVLLGTAMAWGDGGGAALPALAAAAVALLLQIGTNLANDVDDFERGADTAVRLGPPRATQRGWLTATAVRRGALLAFAASAVPGLYLVALGGWPLALLGLLCIAAGAAYTGGPYPLGYHGLGELAVFLFFGVVAVCGTYWVQAHALPPPVLLASVAPGALASAILLVNNLRDRDSDAAAGKRTLAVRLGAAAARRGYAVLLALAYASAGLLALARPAALLAWLTLPLAWRLARRVAREDGGALNEVLAGTARLELVFAALLALGWVG